MGAEVEALGGFSIEPDNPDGLTGGVELGQLVLHPLAEVPGEGRKRSFRLGDSRGIDAAKLPTTKSKLEGIRGVDDLYGVVAAHTRLSNWRLTSET
jgi:hypothetical protein